MHPSVVIQTPEGLYVGFEMRKGTWFTRLGDITQRPVAHFKVASQDGKPLRLKQLGDKSVPLESLTKFLNGDAVRQCLIAQCGVDMKRWIPDPHLQNSYGYFIHVSAHGNEPREVRAAVVICSSLGTVPCLPIDHLLPEAWA